MKRTLWIAVWLAGGLALPAVANAVVGENPYKTIVERNPFGLLPPPPPAPPADTNPPPSNLKLTGITTILGLKNALLMAQEPGPNGKSQSYILTEGQGEGPIEVLAIDSEAGTVKVKNAGVVTTLSFEKDGLKAPTSPVAAIPGAPGGIPAPMGMPGRMGIPAPTAPTIIGSQPAVPTPVSPGQSGGATSSGGLRQIPTRATRLPQTSASLNTSTTANSATTPATASGTPEEQIARQLIEIERNRQIGGPGAAILPPLPGGLQE